MRRRQNKLWVPLLQAEEATVTTTTAFITFMVAIMLLAAFISKAVSPERAVAAGPAWTLTMTPLPANFAPGKTPEYVMVATNVGAASTTGEIELKATLPKAWEIVAYGAINSDPGPAADPVCTPATPILSCKTSEPVASGRVLRAQVRVQIPPGAAKETLEADVSISGGGAQEITATAPTPVQPEAVPFDFLPGFAAPFTDEDGNAVALAGSHSYQQTISFGFPTENPGSGLTNDGHPRDFYVEFPRGVVGSPAASQILCTEAELTSPQGCPDASQVGLTTITTLAGEVGIPDVFVSNLYNMVSPPGSAAEFATNAADIGVYVHVLASVRTDGDYGIEAATRDVIAFGQLPIYNAQAQIWGDPSATAHDGMRGKCRQIGGICPVPPRDTAFLTMPSDCPGDPTLFEVLADTWEDPSPPFGLRRASYESADLVGNPVAVEDCGALGFEPTIEAKPTTNLSDSSSGLDFTLHQPQDTDFESRSPAALKDTTVRFPAGMAVNPSKVNGLEACDQDQIGFRGEEEGALRFSKAPQSCPAAAKLGTLEVTSPVLVRRNAENEVEETPEGDAILEPLKGSIYLAKPFANPFDSLIAVYLVVEDEKTGIVAKLAGRGELDPQTGQITTSFTENPELPIEDIRANIFGGSRGALTTPPTCAAYTTTSALTPWSAPERQDEHPESSFSLGASPLGGPCPTTEAQLPNAPKLVAGSESPTAGKYSPLLFKLSREDGTQRISRIEATLPVGLSAKLAGVGTCSEADIAKARSREEPQKGVLEQASPSCPASSEVGTAVASAGSGPNPYYTTGHAYLSGPYKGAPLSITVVAPAVAGPFDLGAVVVRSALFLDPETAQGRVVSDSLPQILHGVPVDLRSVSVRATRPGFTLNPTSCNEKSFGGQTVSALGQPAPLFGRFQVGGCKSLPYQPKMKVNLFGPIHRGGHPRLKAVFAARPGEANTSRVSFTFPKSEFIDQAHFRTICTRVQFAVNQCPVGSVYGHVRAFTPLLDYPLEGPVYLRSSSHKLPDLVVALRGPAYQPLAIDAVGRVDSVNGGLRVRFQGVPDAPITKLIVTAQGAKKGLFQNSTNICKGTHRATLKLDGQNGKVHDSQPKLVAQCSKGKGGKKAKGGKGHR